MLKYSLLIFLHVIVSGNALFIDGCPAYGCRPSGSFSFYLNITDTNVSIEWGTSFVLNAVPNALGCTSDTVSIICLSNGPFDNNKGYVSLFQTNGSVYWRDNVLKHPSLPLLDNYGDVTGSDGVWLVYYEADGTAYPKIPDQDLVPIYSIGLVGSGFLLLTSAKGDIVVRLTNGLPVGYITLDDVIDNKRGKFLPIAQPVINDMRFYVLSEFVPDNSSFPSEYKTVQRLYAIDVRDSIVNRISIAWYYTFKDGNQQNYERTNVVTSKKTHLDFIEANALNGTQGLLWKQKSKTIFVNLPPPFNSTTKTNSLWGVRDNGTKAVNSFRSDGNFRHMTSFESDHCDNGLDTPVWVSNTSTVCSINSSGLTERCFDVSKILMQTGGISSKLSAIRNDDSDEDILTFGYVTVKSGKVDLASKNFHFSFSVKSASSYVIAIDTSISGPRALWAVPVPDGLEVKGQITGSSGSSTQTKDKLIFYAENSKGVARIYSIS